MENKRPTPASVDDYISGFAPEIQLLLQKVRRSCAALRLTPKS